MTIAVCVKVGDGLVLAADSAVTLSDRDPGTGTLSPRRTYPNANKILNLRKGLPIGAMTWGLGGFNNRSTSSLMKDLRSRFTSPPDDLVEWRVDSNSYSIFDVAERTREFFQAECFDELRRLGVTSGLETGILVAGYSPKGSFPELQLVSFADDGVCDKVQTISDSNSPVYLMWNGMPEAITRLVLGHSEYLGMVLMNALSLDDASTRELLEELRDHLQAPLLEPSMPIQDAIDLAEFLVETTVKFEHFLPGLDSVGGPIEVAAITKHEGFKWIRRKHYYEETLNPREV